MVSAKIFELYFVNTNRRNSGRVIKVMLQFLYFAYPQLVIIGLLYQMQLQLHTYILLFVMKKKIDLNNCYPFI